MGEPPSPKRNKHESSNSFESTPFFDLLWDNPAIWKPDEGSNIQENVQEVSDSQFLENADLLDKAVADHQAAEYDPLEDPEIWTKVDKLVTEALLQLAQHSPTQSPEYDPLEDPEVLAELDKQLARALLQEPEQLNNPRVKQVVDSTVLQVIDRLQNAQQNELDVSDIPGPSWLDPTEHIGRNRVGSSNIHKRKPPNAETVQNEPAFDFDDISDEIWKVMLEQVGGNAPEIPTHLDRFIHVEPQEFRRIKRFHTYATAYSVEFKDIEKAADVEELMYELFEYLIQRTFAIAAPHSLVGVTVSHPALKDGDIYVPFCAENELTPDRIIREIEKVMQSNASLSYDSTMTIRFTRVVPPQGGIRKQNFKGNLQDWVKAKYGHGGALIWIDNEHDNLCLPRAIVTAVAHIHRNDSPAAMREYNNIKKGDRNRYTIQRRKAMELMTLAGLQNYQEKCGLQQLEEIQAALPHYQIKAWSYPAAGCCVFRGPPSEDDAYVVHLFYYNSHFIPITRMPAFFEQIYYCEKCEKPYKQQEHHRCEEKCSCCQKQTNCAIRNWTYCNICNRYFKSHECFNSHKQIVQVTTRAGVVKDTSICKRIWKCRQCQQLVRVERLRGRKHQCGFRYCTTCKEFIQTQGHYCFMAVLKEVDEDEDEGREEDDDSLENIVRQHEQQDGERAVISTRSNKKGWIFFDIESTQDLAMHETALGVTYGHKPNLVICHKVCLQCKEKPVTEISQCNACGKNYHQFDGEQCLEAFCNWLFKKCHKGFIVIAHNLKGYDGQFILTYLHRKGIPPKIVPKGLEIMKLDVDGIKLLDSLNFMPLALKSLPKAFGFTELQKGYFPHFFNTHANRNYEGAYPDPDNYGVSTMKPEARQQFFNWYSMQKNEIFNLWKELVAYCNSDVDILRRSCLKYRELFLTETGVDPFEHCMTIASTCNRVFRRNFLKPHTIGIVPPGGYSSQEKQSVIARKWLHWVSVTRNITIRYVANGREIVVGQGRNKYKVDGQNQENPKQVFEFNGCLWHGCRMCFKNRSTLLPGGEKNVEEAYLDTVQRKLELTRLGFEVEEKWECQLLNDLAHDLDMQQFFKEMELLEPLSPRAAFYGGRTNASVLYWKSQGPHDRARYLDVCSLYPYVCKYGEFPIGHPDVVTENFDLVDKNHHPYKGVMECQMLAPKQLHHPVLPIRLHGKLLFPLCQSCSLEQNPNSCSHTDQQRAITGAWCTPEIYKALDLGYELVGVKQVWHYSTWKQYKRGEEPNSGLFTTYIDCFVKHKQQASDWPRDCDREAYVREYKQHEGIDLDPSKIEKNPGLRFLAKLCLNSFWGKFGQRNDMKKLEYFTDPAKYFECVFNKANVVKRIDIVNDSMVLVDYCKAGEYIEALPTTNPIIAAFVTAQARLKLYGYLELLGDRVLYYDTDSIIFLSSPNEDPPTGCYLGDLTDELDDYGEGSFIEEFVGAGPKNYAYAVRSGRDNKRHEVVKCRGFSLNYAVGQHLNFKTMKEKVKQFVRNGADLYGLPITMPRIRRTRDREVVTQLERKSYRVVYGKRRILADFTTRPFGHVDFI